MEHSELDSQIVELVKNVVIFRQMFITRESLDLSSAEEKMNLDSDMEIHYSEVTIYTVMT